MKFATYSAIGLLGAASAFSAIVNVPGGIYTGVINWTANNEYHIGGAPSGAVYIGDNGSGTPGVLNIAPGTVIKGLPGEGVLASALVITKNGTINANGTPDSAIVFTTVYDNVNDPTDLGPYDRAFWGGVIILGEAPLTESVPQVIEGISNVLQGEYGGSNVNDNSGSFSYVSIRHGGKIIGGANEINGLTMGGVGAGTTIHHVEVFANNDDGFEWFGGTVNAKYLISAYGNDDAFDFDFGYRGKLQYAYSVYHNGNTDGTGNQGIEGDGYQFPLTPTTDTTKASMPKWSNLTLAGSGPLVSTLWGTANDFAFRIREGAGGDFKNSIFQDWRDKIGRFDVGGPCWADCRILQDSLNFDGSIFNAFGPSINAGNYTTSAAFSGLSPASQAIIGATSAFAPTGVSNGVTFGSVDPRPTPAGIAFTIAHDNMGGDPFFDAVNYAGAFGFENWAYKWTNMWQSGIMKRGLRMQPGVANFRESKLTPARIIQSANWDFVLFQTSLTPVNLAASTAFLDGTNVTATFQAGVWPAGQNNVTTGERTYRVNAQSGFTFGPLGKHVLRLHMVLTNGVVLDEEFWFETVTQI
jgi:hypothetical protein